MDLERVTSMIVECLEECDHARKQVLESHLHELRCHKEAKELGFCLLAMPCDKNDKKAMYCHWFATSIFEHLVSERAGDLSSIRDSVMEFLLHKEGTVSPFIINKLAKIVVDIAQIQWPEEDPYFLQRVKHLGENCLATSCIILRVAAEQFGSDKGHVSTARRSALRAVMIENLPEIMQWMEFALQKAAAGKGDARAEEITCRALEVVLQFFVWVPLEKCLSDSLLGTVFRFIETDGEVGMLAFSCVNEILSRSFAPAIVRNLLDHVFSSIFKILESLTREPDVMELISEAYLGKLIEFLNLFVSHHIPRLLTDPSFPIDKFFLLFFKFTFMQPTTEGLMSCLQVWSIFLQFIVSKAEEDPTSLPFEEGIIAVLSELLKKIQFTTNTEMLLELDDEREVDGKDTELGLFMKRGLEVISKIAELYPQEVSRMSNERFSACADSFGRIFMAYKQDSNSLSGNMKEEGISVLQDMKTYVKVFGILGNYFVTNFGKCFTEGHKMLLQIEEILQYVQESALSSHSWPLAEISSQFHLELFSTMRTYMFWLSRFEGELRAMKSGDQNGKASDELVKQIDSHVMTTLLLCRECILSTNTNIDVRLAATQTLTSLVYTVRPRRLLVAAEMEEFLSVIGSVWKDKEKHPSELIVSVCDCACQMYLLPLPGIALENQQWEERKSRLAAFLRPFLATLFEFAALPSFGEDPLVHNDPIVIQCIATIYTMLSRIMKTISVEGTNAKYVFFEVAIKDIIPLTESFFKLYMTNSLLTRNFLIFFSRLFDSMKAQLGVERIGEIVTLLLQVISGINFKHLVETNNKAEVQVITTLLNVFSSIVQHESSALHPVIPDVVSTVLNMYSEVMKQLEVAVTVLPDMYDFMYFLFLHKWKLYVSENNEECSENAHFMIEAMYFGLQVVDINVVKHLCKVMMELNDKRKLLQRKFFIVKYRTAFMRMLLHVLISRSVDILRDSLVDLLFAIASVDLWDFYCQFLPAFFTQFHSYEIPASLTVNPPPTDFHSFRCAVDCIVSDCNSHVAKS